MILGIMAGATLTIIATGIMDHIIIPIGVPLGIGIHGTVLGITVRGIAPGTVLTIMGIMDTTAITDIMDTIIPVIIIIIHPIMLVTQTTDDVPLQV